MFRYPLTTLSLLSIIAITGCDGHQGPAVSSRFLSNVELKATLTDGTVREYVLRPCEYRGFFGMGPPFRQHPRSVFVESVVISRGGETIRQYDRQTIEGVADGMMNVVHSIILDESGYRSPTRWSHRCATVVSVFDSPVRAEFHYDTGERWTTVWRPCKVHLWESVMGRQGADLPPARAQRLIVSRDGEVVLDLDRKAIKVEFSDFRKPSMFPVLYVVGSGGFDTFEYPKKMTGHPVSQCDAA